MEAFFSMLALVSSVNAGDDTPIKLYIIVGVVALVLLILAAVLSSAAKKKK